MTRRQKLTHFRKWARQTLWGPQLLAFLPAICLGAYWIVGEGGLIAVALGLPVVWAILGGFHSASPQDGHASARTSVTPRELIAGRLTALIDGADDEARSAIFAISLDDGEGQTDRIEGSVLHDLRDQMARRLQSLLRDTDLVILSGHLEWIVALNPGPRLDLEVVIQQASRLQGATDEPFVLGDARHYCCSTIGFRLMRLGQDRDCEEVISNASEALKSALIAGPGSIRAHSPALVSNTAAPRLARPANDPISMGHDHTLIAWYQPQISTDTGAVSGFEALARMNDPEKGILPPAAFMPAIERAGQLERLSEIMLAQSLDALKAWDADELGIDTIGVNFSAQDLLNPRLYDKIAWELDRRDVPPHRLSVEILETVIATGTDDIVTRNVSKLASLGCQIDLDDFGTGHASISTLRRLPITRLKIDRSFVAHADLDSEQQKMVATILMMAERMGLTTLAEGVETVGEHAVLSQLGCRYVQGYGIAKPMPLAETADWVKSYRARLAKVPSITRKTG